MMERFLKALDLHPRLKWALWGFIVLIIFGAFSQYVLWKDNPIEEAAEKVIKEKTGLEVDFSPEKRPKRNTW